MSISTAPTTVDNAKKLGLTEEEFKRIEQILGRNPNFTELSIFSVMWSEHCSYKNSIKYLKKLPRKGDHLLVEAGEENAGLVDIGGGLACAFKIESHNHPSAIEPYQGAATGVGGIHRDIFTMGARPIAALNSLRFGNIKNKHTQHLVKGVVSGIGDYGNCLGVPTVGGEVYFDDCYNQNILVNAMSIGIVEVGKTVSAISEGPGNPVFIVGSATGKDGIHGATFASADLTEDSADDLPAVQVGDPFQEKLLLEASLEAIETGAIVGMQDMGAAGISCSTSEMSAKGGCGMKIDLSKVPTRQDNMEPFEKLLSESQERMLIVCHKGREKELQAVFDKWDLECELIGEVTDTGRLEFFENGELVADIPAEPLVLGGGAPVYDREFEEPAYYKQLSAFNIQSVPPINDLASTFKKVFSNPVIASKKWVFNQYDSMVRTGTMTTNAASDAATIRLKNSDKALLASTDCNSSYVYADPYIGGMIAVSESARNIVCAGGKPVAITNCLNFGNPYDKNVYWQFVNALKGMGDACIKFKTPVTGGNVSFYNQSVIQDKTVPIYPTPVIGMLGILENPENHMTLDFKSEGDLLFLIGTSRNDINQSVYLKDVIGTKSSPAPHFDLEEEAKLQDYIADGIEKSLFKSVHDVSEGGLLTTVAESCLHGNIGCEIHSQMDIRQDAFLFGESQSRVIVSADASKRDDIFKLASQMDQNISFLGTVGGKALVVDGITISDLNELTISYNHTLPHYLEN